MRLFAVLCWWEESPTWLAACVGSLARLGVDHVVAVDGRYPHFAPGELARSGVEQSEAIVYAAEAAGIGATLVRPQFAVWTEVEKRAVGFRLVEALATRFEDWVVVIDADELVVDGGHDVKQELRELPGDVHCASSRVTNALDPFAAPGPDNDVNAKTQEIHQKLPVSTRFTALQSRFWRVMQDMTVRTTHYGYVGTDEHGIEWNLRPDIGGTSFAAGLPRTVIAQLHHSPVIEHRKNWRGFHRREQKKTYYDFRDETGIERVPPSA